MKKTEKEEELPSDNIQKIYEVNPVFILEKIRNEKKMI